MAKKRGSGWQGIRDAYNLHEAMDMLARLRRSGDQVRGELAEMAMMVVALAAVIGLFYLIG